ncbi:adenosylcobinamide-GDP ribazoletransferase [Robbsia sp. KACC 23696]|uniref:adenosylcobinamide-GDP ribazoletransferase n=1 Tax=Robbsia sp. KACC 23696 TaxID=3149231 RepID=UPI00325BEE2A
MTDSPEKRAHPAWREEVQTIAIAFGYFTRFPVPHGVGYSDARLARSGRYFPLVGAVVGALGALVFAIGSHFWPLSVALLLSMAATLLATGALHEDGLADCCDAFGGAYRRADVLRILKDSRIGVFGAVGLIVTLTLKWQALLGLTIGGPGVVCAWMIIAHAASRAGAIVFTATLDYARSPVEAATGAANANGAAEVESGGQPRSANDSHAAQAASSGDTIQDATSDAKARPFQRNGGAGSRDTSTRDGVAIALLLGLPGLFWHGIGLGLVLIGAGAAVHWMLGRWWQRRIGGYTGDCLGLAQQLFEVGIYLVVLGWISS